MSKIRVLVVEPEVVVRRLAASVLADDAELEVVGTLPSADLALARIPQVNPDLVLAGMALPEVGGEDPLTALRKAFPLLPVVLFANPLPRSAEGKSCHRNLPEVIAAAVRQLAEIIPRLKTSHARCQGTANASGSCVTARKSNQGLEPARKSSPGLRWQPRVEIVAVGASTGGPQALAALLTTLPAHCPVPVVIVQHVLRGFSGFLAQRLASAVQGEVSEARPNRLVQPGQILIAPSDQHLEVMRTPEGVCVRLHDGPPENSCRPSVDVLFRSVAQTYGAGALTVVLTGMGKDGLQGCESVRQLGGQVLVQDEDTSVVWGMAGMVARAGLADQVLPLPQIGPEVLRRIRRGRSSSSAGLAHETIQGES
jgi:two-component system chemotaxis response regulator CheB